VFIVYGKGLLCVLVNVCHYFINAKGLLLVFFS
jgi:hypothetical protein